MLGSRFHILVALLLATNYFAFQVELFEEEYEANHRQVSDAPAVGSPTLTWESFDKENAPQPYVIDAVVTLEFLLKLPALPPAVLPARVPFRVIHDKSPPPGSL